MATLNEFIELISDELGVDTDDVKVEIKGGKVLVEIKNIDEDDVFDEDYGLGGDDGDDK